MLDIFPKQEYLPICCDSKVHISFYDLSLYDLMGKGKSLTLEMNLRWTPLTSGLSCHIEVTLDNPHFIYP